MEIEPLPATTREPIYPIRDGTVSGELEAVRADVTQRVQVWREQCVPLRKFALLVAHFYDRHYPLRSGRGRELIRLVTESAVRLVTSDELERACELQRQETDALAPQMSDLLTIVREPYFYAADNLCKALTDPALAVAQMVGDEPCGWYSANCWVSDVPFFREIMECLRPASWDRPVADWTPPPEAVEWARRIDQQEAFSELPYLADMLEDADCPDRPLLDHCRNSRCHFRGCAVLDRLLGVEREESAPHLRLVGLDELRGRVWRLSGPFEIGRADGRILSDVRPDSVSRRHAAVTVNESGWWVFDMGSTNGTFVAGGQIRAGSRGLLLAGNTVQVGSVSMRVVFASPSPPSAMLYAMSNAQPVTGLVIPPFPISSTG